MDDKSKRLQDGKTISLSEEWELDYWTNALGVTRDQLRGAVAAVGVSAERVKEYLASRDLP